MKHLYLIFTLAVIMHANSQEKLEIDGAIVIKNSEDPSPAEGTIRYNPGTGDFEGWNGVFWASLTGFQLGSVTDIDGNVYKTVTIGIHVMMAENLRVSKYRNGDPLPNVTNNTDWGNLGSGAYCWYDNDNDYEQPYGKLYNWYAVNDGRGLCPTGWNAASDHDWSTLIDYLDASNVEYDVVGVQSTVAGGLMKEVGITHWNTPNSAVTNESGFTGLPGGFRHSDGMFYGLRDYGYWWNSTESLANAWYRVLSYNSGNVDRNNGDKRLGFSVRCIKD